MNLEVLRQTSLENQTEQSPPFIILPIREALPFNNPVRQETIQSEYGKKEFLAQIFWYSASAIFISQAFIEGYNGNLIEAGALGAAGLYCLYKALKLSRHRV